MNLDPTETLPDVSLWNALGMVDLKKYLIGSNLGLDYRITEGGGNFRLVSAFGVRIYSIDIFRSRPKRAMLNFISVWGKGN